MERDPIEFLRKESFAIGAGGTGGGPSQRSKTERNKKKRELFGAADIHQVDLVMGSDSSDEEGGRDMGMNDMDFIDELETEFHDAHDHILTSSGLDPSPLMKSRVRSSMHQRQNRDELYQIEEADENAGEDRGPSG